MKKWTCCILSLVLLAVSAFVPKNKESVVLAGEQYSLGKFNSESFSEEMLRKIVEYFTGIKNESKTEISVDLTQEPNDEMKIEIEKINQEIVEENNTEQKTEEVKSEKRKVLIYHTHTDEAYLKGEQNYKETSVGRTLNPEYSVVSVGEKLTQELEKYGFEVIHDTTDNVSAGFNRAYQTSYDTIKKYIGKVDIYVDLHRDAYMGQSENYLIKDGIEYSKVCFVVANGENYTYKPKWQENYKVAQKLNEKLNEICPGICKKTVFKNARFNQHVSESCLLIEMGNEQNTLEQVKSSAVLVAQAMNEIF